MKLKGWKTKRQTWKLRFESTFSISLKSSDSMQFCLFAYPFVHFVLLLVVVDDGPPDSHDEPEDELGGLSLPQR